VSRENFRFATRVSALALWQTRYVISSLLERNPDRKFEEYPIVTRGDKVLDVALPAIGGKGVFTEELEWALLNGAADCATHSLKDLPVDEPAGLTVGCIPLRAEARDVLISPRFLTLEKLPEGALVGTSSLRRAAQLLALRPDLRTRSIRGNVETRIRKVVEGEYDAVILAGAGVTRLGIAGQVTQYLELDQMLPAPGQGALAVQCRTNDHEILSMLAEIEHAPTRAQVTAERAFLQGLGGGCSVPVAAFAKVEMGTIHLHGLVISADGKRKIVVNASGNDPLSVGRTCAEEALANGAQEILASRSMIGDEE